MLIFTIKTQWYIYTYHTYQPSRESLDIQGFDLLFRDLGIHKKKLGFYALTNHIVDITIYTKLT